MQLPCRNLTLDLSCTRVMAIVNVTPDSFSDGGKYYRPEEAIARAVNCVREGADILDFGGESTRPGATPLTWEEEWSRLEPVFAGLPSALRSARLPDIPISIDTYHPETARRAITAGCHMLNCVYSEPIREMMRLASESGCALVAPCRSSAEWDSIRADAVRVLGEQNAAELAPRIVIDPEIGFGTTREEDIALLGGLRRLAQCAPVCIGVSRKRLIKKLTGEKCRGKNLGGSVGAAVWCAMCGAAIVRVHDVEETFQAINVANALANAYAPDSPQPCPTAEHCQQEAIA